MTSSHASRLRDIYLYGDLAERFGAHHRYAVKSIPEAMWALDANHGGFFRALKKDGRYRVVCGPSLDDEASTQLATDQLWMSFGQGAFHIAPVIEGAGSGGGKTVGMVVLGVALMATGVGGALYAGTSLAAGLGTALPGFVGTAFGITWGSVALLGAALTLGGIAQALTPTPEVQSYDVRESEKHRKSWIFNGPRNSVEEGGCIPVVFGRYWVGSTMVSAGIEIKDPGA